MNHRDWHGKIFIGIFLLFIIGIIFTQSVQGQEVVTTATPLSTVSTYVLPKEQAGESNNPNSIPEPGSDDSDEITPNHIIPVPFPQPDITFDKVCEPTDLAVGEEIACTITIQNNGTDYIYYKLLDWTSPFLSIDEESVVGGTLHRHNIITQHGLLAPGTPPTMTLEIIDSPIIYDSLGELGVAPLENVDDESMINVSTLEPYIYDGEEYVTIGISSNGYLIPGLGSDEDIDYIPQIFPDPTIPNNVIAPFWTDLNPGAGGNIYAALYTRDEESWVVIEWEDVPAFASEKPVPNCVENCSEQYTFQVWIKTNTTEQEITFIYARVDGSGAASGLNVGVENINGTVGANYEAVPVTDDKIGVITTPGTAGESYEVSYTAEAARPGYWHGCALMKVFGVRGITFDCVYGTITK